MTKLTEKTKAFIRSMKDWGYYYPEMAGCHVLSISEDHEINGDAILPGAGDWVVYDKRLYSGTYGVSHEDGSIYKLTIKRPEKHHVDYSKKPLKSVVGCETLMQRYHWISNLFIDWAHVLAPTPYRIWKNAEALNKDYENEKKELNTDPYLALYWLLHFGFSLDKRYEEVKAVVTQNQLQSQLLYIDRALSFFSDTDPFYDIPLEPGYGYGRKEGLEQIFLKRRSYLVYHTQSQSYRGGENNFENWWYSITIYPNAEKNMPFRMRWLRNNVKKFDNWQQLDDQLSNYNGPEISLMPYALACHPNRGDRADQANKFLMEVWENKNLWKNPDQKRFLQAMIWDVRQLATDTGQLSQSADYYFKDATLDEMYLDIQKIMGTENENIQTISAAKDQLLTIFKADVAEESLYKKVADFLDILEPEILFSLAKNIEDKALNKCLFRYLFLKDIPP